MKTISLLLTLLIFASLSSGCLSHIGDAQREKMKREAQMYQSMSSPDDKKYEYIDEEDNDEQSKNDDTP